MKAKTKTTATNEEATPALVPKLRFPEFRGTKWDEKKIGSMLIETSRPIELEDETEYNLVTVKRRYGGLVSRGKLKGREIKVSTQFLVHEGDFLISKRQIVHDACGLVPETLDGAVVSNEYSVLTPKAGCSVEFINWFAQQPCISRSFLQCSVGIVIEKMLFKLDAWLKREFLFPSPAEQQKIAECLSSVDELMAAQARKVDALKTHKKALMQQLFPREGETQPRLRFPEFQNAGEWEVGFIGDLATTVMGNAFRSTDFVESGTQVVRIGNLYQGELQLDRAPVYLSDAQAEENSKFRIHPLDLLMSMTGTVGKRDYGFVIQVPPDCKPLLLNQRVMKLASTIKCDPGFLLQLLKSDRLLDAIYSVPGGTKQANLSAQHIKDLEVSYPPKLEQQRLATCLSSLDALITAETQKLEALKTHKKGLMQQLFPSPEEVAG